MWIIVIVAGVLAAAFAVMYGVGASLPREHSMSRSIILRARREEVFAVVANFGEHGAWRKDVKKMEALPPQDGKSIVRETNGFGVITMRVDESSPPSRLVTVIADDDLPFGGRWTYALEAAGDGCRVTITEDGFVKPPLFRFMSRYMFGYSATIDGFLKALGARFGETVVPQ